MGAGGGGGGDPPSAPTFSLYTHRKWGPCSDPRIYWAEREFSKHRWGRGGGMKSGGMVGAGKESGCMENLNVARLKPLKRKGYYAGSLCEN